MIEMIARERLVSREVNRMRERPPRPVRAKAARIVDVEATYDFPMIGDDGGQTGEGTTRIDWIDIDAVCGAFAALAAVSRIVFIALPYQPIGDGDYPHVRGSTHMGFRAFSIACGFRIWAFTAHRLASRLATGLRLVWCLPPLLIFAGIALFRHGQSLGSFNYHHGER